MPELRLGYVPEGFGLEETPELSESIVKYVSKAQEAVFYASIMPYDRQKYMYLCADDAEQIVVGGRERIKSKQTDDMAIYLYAWKEGEYLLYLYTYEVEEGEAERILEAFSFQETGN